MSFVDEVERLWNRSETSFITFSNDEPNAEASAIPLSPMRTEQQQASPLTPRAALVSEPMTIKEFSTASCKLSSANTVDHYAGTQIPDLVK